MGAPRSASTRRIAMAAVLAAISLAGGSALAERYLFRWLGADGVLHVTDRLDDVPEPYYSAYAARLKQIEEEREKRAKEAGGRPPRPSGDDAPAELPRAPRPKSVPRGAADNILARQAWWKAEVARWRHELMEATDALRRIEEELGTLQSNALLAVTGPAKTRIAELEGEQPKAAARVEKAKSQLLEGLPAQAKKEGVPPRWLD